MATIKDIAKIAGVSTSAVSRILNNDPTLSTALETRQRVIQVAKKLNYRKTSKINKAAYRLGIVQWVSAQQEVLDSYYLSIRQGIEDFCIRNCIHILRTFRSDLDYLQQIQGADGLICIGKFGRADMKAISELAKNVVYLDMPIKDYAATEFTLDFKEAVYMAMDYLTGLGHTKIALLTGLEYVDDNEEFPDERGHYYRKYCRAHGLDYKTYFREGLFDIESGYKMMADLLAGGARPTAVFAASDNIAVGAMKAIKKFGLKIPEDISIIGFDDSQICSFTTPALTTIHAPAYEMGQYGVNFLFAASNMSAVTPIRVKMHCTLVERESCARAKNEGDVD